MAAPLLSATQTKLISAAPLLMQVSRLPFENIQTNTSRTRNVRGLQSGVYGLARLKCLGITENAEGSSQKRVACYRRDVLPNQPHYRLSAP